MALISIQCFITAFLISFSLVFTEVTWTPSNAPKPDSEDRSEWNLNVL